jgi:LacI family transcriptional regulator
LRENGRVHEDADDDRAERGGPTTLADVALRAGVSVSSASRVLGGRGEVRAETRARILRAAADLGYRRAGTRRGRPALHEPRLIELVVGRFGNPWTRTVAEAARDRAAALGYDLALTVERADPADDWCARVVARRSSGVILGVTTPTAAERDALRDLRIPLVLLDPRAEVPRGTTSVGTTDRAGGRDAGAHLAERGATAFLVVAGAPRFRFGRAREAGFRDAVRAARPDAPLHRMTTGWSADEVVDPAALVRAVADAAAAGGPLGVFAVTDDMAFAVCRAAAVAGLRVPEDLLVVGFDDEPRAAVARPPLTTVRQPLAAMAARAVDLVHAARTGSPADAHVELPTRLVVRGSTGG